MGWGPGGRVRGSCGGDGVGAAHLLNKVNHLCFLL